VHYAAPSAAFVGDQLGSQFVNSIMGQVECTGEMRLFEIGWSERLYHHEAVVSIELRP